MTKKQKIFLGEFVEFDAPQKEPGDFTILSQLDSVGRANLRGNHCNLGYSGFLKVLIFNGSKWFTLRSADVKQIGQTNYGTQYEKDELVNIIKANLKYKSGEGGPTQVQFWYWQRKLYCKFVAES